VNRSTNAQREPYPGKPHADSKAESLRSNDDPDLVQRARKFRPMIHSEKPDPEFLKTLPPSPDTRNTDTGSLTIDLYRVTTPLGDDLKAKV